MDGRAQPLIVGAGATGLAAALFLHERGIGARVVDAAAEPSPWSKALGLNARTLELLEPSGVTAAIRAEGYAVQRLEIRRAGGPPAVIPLDYAAIGARHPMTILPQARTEALLAEALAARGVSVERGVRFTGLSQDAAGVRASLARPDGSQETVPSPLLLGADGAHSDVREAIGSGFPGDAFPETWSLADLELEGPPSGAITVDFQPEGPFALIPFSERFWRIVAMGSGAVERLPRGWKAGEVVWRSEFRISHRLADPFTAGRVALAGDAAHIHSPIGARGLNLGVEDAWVFAACAADALAGRLERLEDYGRLRRAVDARVIRQVRRLTQTGRARGPAAQAARSLGPPVAARVPAIRRALLRQVAGLDHPVLTA